MERDCSKRIFSEPARSARLRWDREGTGVAKRRCSWNRVWEREEQGFMGVERVARRD